ncbi:EF-hand domain-containing protein [Marinomonas pollencensis]|uniref:EF hand domain-containing protein n=1 Tax=Marinomonas pollencensis TaxID=491954 RepID=A0A3E0DI72_9GAMM|nr:EF-hand domain-containing protein [Marinomonas pollencensis]REG82385.1 EF hand domain-containing protein [Marinomonas pollencensis]
MKKLSTAVLLPVITASVLTLFSVNSLAAGGQPPQAPPSFSQMDTNGDGVLTKDEVKGPLADDFDRFDADHSGSLTEEELPAPPSH